MKRRTFIMVKISSFVILFAILIGCAETRPAKNCDTFKEMADPTVDTLSDWSKVPVGLNLSFASIDTKFPKSIAPDITKKATHSITGWKGERLSAQLLLWSTDSIKQVECEIGDFKSQTSVLASNIAKARFVRYVMTDIFEPGCGYRKPEDFPASLTADMLDNIECFDIEAKTVRPVWISVNIPATANAGTYKSKIKIYGKGQAAQEIELELNIQDKVLPPASDWEYYLDLWQHPSAVARTEGLKVWSEEHFDAMKPLYKMLADAGQKVITTTLNKDPWNVQTYDPYEDMIIWTKNADGSWTYDYTIFDKWVSFMIDLGIKKGINCYSLVPWNNELHYKDAVTNEVKTVKANPGTKMFEDMWKPFLSDFNKHLQGKGWLNITNIAMDERAPKEMEATLKFLANNAPDFGIAFADNHKSYKKYPYIKDMCVAADAKVDSADIASRRKKGLITNYYVCCSDKFPNVFTFSDYPEAVYSAWYSVAAGYDGYLRWAYNSWVEKPLTDSRFRTWPAGDTYIVYPNARTSVRFERLIEGIQDAEKIRILRNEFTKANSQESLEKLNQLNIEVAKFNTIKPTQPYAEMLHNAKDIINKLSQ
ncbi:glycoside hydrolase domain-containing protein [Dysgonomonas sp. BGC7]|uniref:DUF4091 domain-containing protein n=1 Tax=Dysgonomonas sp. BGC7 TaxID=1658008 RepID=UPI000A830F2C|nr:glycoside hydrolase domain-containing protein [Dysgonomonas sp. BGC7]